MDGKAVVVVPGDQPLRPPGPLAFGSFTISGSWPTGIGIACTMVVFIARSKACSARVGQTRVGWGRRICPSTAANSCSGTPSTLTPWPCSAALGATTAQTGPPSSAACCAPSIAPCRSGTLAPHRLERLRSSLGELEMGPSIPSPGHCFRTPVHCGCNRNRSTVPAKQAIAAGIRRHGGSDRYRHRAQGGRVLARAAAGAGADAGPSRSGRGHGRKGAFHHPFRRWTGTTPARFREGPQAQR